MDLNGSLRRSVNSHGTRHAGNFSNPTLYAGGTLPIAGDMITPRAIVEDFQQVTGIKAEYRNAFMRDGLLQNFPAFAGNELLMREILGMVEYAVEFGYYGKEHDLGWSRRITPETLSWEQFLQTTGWRGGGRRALAFISMRSGTARSWRLGFLGNRSFRSLRAA